MKWFILADIHSNLPALEVVLGDIEKRSDVLKKKGEDKLIVPGDIIGYGCYPNEVMDIVWPIADEILLGNHELFTDEWMREGKLTKSCSTDTGGAVDWTAKNLTSVNQERLNCLVESQKYLLNLGDICFAHSSPDRPKEMLYLRDLEGAILHYFCTDLPPSRVCFVGHTHVPKVYCCTSFETQELTVIQNRPGSVNYSLKGFDQTLVVVPSIGQPRDKIPSAGYAIYDTEKDTVEMIRIPYDIPRIQSKMKDLRFPERLIGRLALGK